MRSVERQIATFHPKSERTNRFGNNISPGGRGHQPSDASTYGLSARARSAKGITRPETVGYFGTRWPRTSAATVHPKRNPGGYGRRSGTVGPFINRNRDDRTGLTTNTRRLLLGRIRFSIFRDSLLVVVITRVNVREVHGLQTISACVCVCVYVPGRPPPHGQGLLKTKMPYN